jgi:hypothetical protein
MFDKELSFFKENQPELVKKYGGKVLVIKEAEVVGVYETNIDAYINALKAYTLGSFMIQPCTPGPEAYTVTISTSELISG